MKVLCLILILSSVFLSVNLNHVRGVGQTISLPDGTILCLPQSVSGLNVAKQNCCLPFLSVYLSLTQLFWYVNCPISKSTVRNTTGYCGIGIQIHAWFTQARAGLSNNNAMTRFFLSYKRPETWKTETWDTRTNPLLTSHKHTHTRTCCGESGSLCRAVQLVGGFHTGDWRAGGQR